MRHYILRQRQWNAPFRISEMVDWKETIVAYFVEYSDAETYCQCESNGWPFEDFVTGEGLLENEPKTITLEELLVRLHSGEAIECEVNKEVFEQVRRYKGQSYIAENSEIKVLNIDGITVRPRIKNIYLKKDRSRIPFPCEKAELEDLPV